MGNSQSKFKQNNPDYFKDYYIKNKDKFKVRNKNRKSQRKYCYVIELEGKKYCFNCKKDVPIRKTYVNNIDQNDYIMVKYN